jgi:Fe-S-cluster-containing dehydrogenase component
MTDEDRPHQDVLDERGEIAAWSRRAFLRVMGASVALGGLAACERPKDKIVPYVRQPEDVVPGNASYYATAREHAGLGFGLLVESHEGRPTKVEGNPRHPASRGATDLHSQASVLSLYDPDRARAVTERGAPRPFRAFSEAFVRACPPARRGEGLFLLLEPTSSPLVEAAIGRLRAALPAATVAYASARAPHARWAAARAAFGRVVEPQLDVSKADVVASFGADLLAARADTVHVARALMERRRVRARTDTMSRLWVAETAMTVSGATCDERMALRPSEMVPALAALLGELARSGGAAAIPEAARARLAALHGGPRAAWTAALARDLARGGAAGVVTCGDDVPLAGHVLAHAVNAALRSKSVFYTRSPIIEAGEASHDPRRLADAVDRKAVATLVILGGNPAYAMPGDLEMARRLREVPLSAYLGEYADETARACTWHVAEQHWLESWGDVRAFDGTLSLAQPLVAPMHGGRGRVEVLGALLGDLAADPHALLRAAHRAGAGAGTGATGAAGAEDDAWEQALARGVLDQTSFAAEPVTLDWARVVAEAERAAAPAPTGGTGAYELAVVLDTKLDDGRLANNAWLQELPDPITKQTWGNALLVSPRTAKELGVATGEVVAVELAGATQASHTAVEAPVLVSPGHADGAATIALGYGRTDGLSEAARVGVSVQSLRSTSRAPIAARLRPTGKHESLAITMAPLSSQDREIIKSLTLAEHREPITDARRREDDEKKRKSRRSLYFLAPGGAQQWAMSIDLTACTGCSVCVVACQAENNVPVVGKEGVLAGREMHWLRIDRYVEDAEGKPRIEMMPMLCQHCESAPCEYVCPTGATNHSADGLNQMVYPRCVGTRFCSNNCPYKVRRFNWFDYNRDTPALRALAHNPDVTVRARGVMEKCSYCVQRIREAERQARVEHRPLATGDVVTACQQACPTQAIQFGSLNDGASLVAKLRDDVRAYSALGELGVRPRTTYLARLRNTSPDVEPGGGDK